MKVIATLAFLASLMLSNVNAFDVSYFVPNAQTTLQPSAVLRWNGNAEVVEVCTNDGSGVACTSGTFLQGDETWTTPTRYIKQGPECGGETVYSAPTITAAPTNKQENVLYMYVQTYNNKVAGFQWSGVPSSPSCVNSNIWNDFDAYTTPGAFYVENGANSFVLVSGVTLEGRVRTARDSRTNGRTQAVEVYDEWNYWLRMSTSPSFVQDSPDTLLMYYTGTDNNIITLYSNVYEFNNGPNGVWRHANQLTSTASGIPRPSYQFSVRVAKNVDDTSDFMLWTKENQFIRNDYAKQLTDTTWKYADQDSSQKPGSSCSELVSFHHRGWNERWTLCFYKGYNNNRVWWMGYAKPL